ncbi:MAG: hypothetical protein Q9181_007939 [Wetmoreana brouardii]
MEQNNRSDEDDDFRQFAEVTSTQAPATDDEMDTKDRSSIQNQIHYNEEREKGYTSFTSKGWATKSNASRSNRIAEIKQRAARKRLLYIDKINKAMASGRRNLEDTSADSIQLVQYGANGGGILARMIVEIFAEYRREGSSRVTRDA